MKQTLLSVAMASAWLLSSFDAAAQAPSEPPPLPPPAQEPAAQEPAAEPVAAPPAPAPAAPAAGPGAAAAPPAPPRPVAPAEPEKDVAAQPTGVDGAPAAQTGFQLAIRSGIQVPAGSVSGEPNDGMSDVFATQWPVMFEIGGKPTPHLFLGAYFGVGVGGAGGALADACARENATCVAANVRLGFEIQYHGAPDKKTNPWIGYGIGYESSAVSGSGNGNNVTASVVGPEYAHFSAGLDFRLSHTVGLGPVVGLSLGQYTHAKTEINGTTNEGDIQNTALHEWVSLGLRLVFFP
jgi:hypothetical protein